MGLENPESEILEIGAFPDFRPNVDTPTKRPTLWESENRNKKLVYVTLRRQVTPHTPKNDRSEAWEEMIGRCHFG